MSEMTRTSHLFKDEAGELSEVSVRVADTPEAWDASDEARGPGWSVSLGVPTVAVRLTRTMRPTPPVGDVVHATADRPW